MNLKPGHQPPRNTPHTPSESLHSNQTSRHNSNSRTISYESTLENETSNNSQNLSTHSAQLAGPDASTIANSQAIGHW